MNNFKGYLGKNICVELPGKQTTKGLLIDVGTDLIVIYNGKDFLYIPFAHVHLLYLNEEDEDDIVYPSETPFENESDILSVRKILNNSKGVFTEVAIDKNQVLHGYVTNVMNDYFVFYSPVCHTVYISLQHLKWLIPYKTEQVPYSLDRTTFASYPSTLSLARSLDEQIKKLFGKIVIFDLGGSSRKVGQLKSFRNNILELVTAREEVTYVNSRHVKSVHIPSK